MSEEMKLNIIQLMIVIKWTGNGIGAEGASKISESLMVNTTLTELDLYGNEEWAIKEKKNEWRNEWNDDKWRTGNSIGDSGAIKMSELLRKNTTLTTLNLKYVT